MQLHSISPVQWQRGKADASQISVISSYDDLKTGATFQVSVYDADGNQVDQVNVSCTGNDYIGWNGSNDFPLQFVAQKLELTLKNQNDASE